jgi:hypothetical protein
MTNYFEKPKYPEEFNEIAEKIASGQAAISWDDILDFHFALKKYNANIKRQNARKQNDTKYRRVPK